RKILGWKLGELHRLKNDLKRHREETRELQNELQVTQNTAMESVKLLHAVLGAVQQGVVSTDSSGEIILVNPQICEMFGYSEEELVGKNIQILMPEKYREPHRQGLERYRKTRKSRAIGQRLILEGLRKDNSIFPLELYLTETRVGDRTIFTAAMRNISQEVKKEEEQKKATEELRFAERRFRHLLEVTDNIVFTLSLDGTFTHINPALTRRTGWAAEEWLNRPFIELVHPESATGVLKHFQQVMKGQKVTLEEVHIRTREDEALITRLNLIPLEFGGKITGALGVLQDETVRQKARQALKAGEARYRTFLENAPVGIAIEQEGKVVFVNPAAARMLELPDPGAMVGRSLTELAAPEGRPAFRAAILNVLKANQKPIRREEKFVTPSGKEILVEVVTQKTMYKGKKAVQFFLRDLTAVAELQSLRQVASDRLRFLLENIPRPALLQDSEGFIVDANAAAAELLGTERSSLVGKVVLQFIPRPEREKFTAQMADLLNGRQETGEIGLVNATGESIPVAVQARRIELPEKPLQLVLLEDLRPHKAQEQEQESLQQRHEELRLRAEQLQNEVATLQEKLRAVGQLVPVCASCKKVRDDQGFWRRLESFVEDPGNAELLFGICPECSDQAHSRAVTNNARTDTR
ncbi:MAG: PAS domain S-box protein, partial [Calditrichaeota bacterium]